MGGVGVENEGTDSAQGRGFGFVAGIEREECDSDSRSLPVFVLPHPRAQER